MSRRTWRLAAGGTAGLVVAATVCCLAVMSTAKRATASDQQAPPSTVKVARGALSDRISQYGTLTYRTRSDGSAYSVINQARGTYTELPAVGDRVNCGDVLYRVDDRPVLLLCGRTPAYRSLSQGANGSDVAELNSELVHRGYATTAQLDPASRDFSNVTAFALQKLQLKLGDEPAGSLNLGQAVFLPESVRIAAVTGGPGGQAQPAAPVLTATSDTPEVQVGLDPSQQEAVKKGDRAQITLPGNISLTGRVDRLGAVTQATAGQNGAGQGSSSGSATFPVYISLDDPEKARGFDRATVQAAITTSGVEDVLSVPVTAIVAKAGGGFAVERARTDGTRELVAVTLGLFDNADGRVQVDGALREGDDVVVPSS